MPAGERRYPYFNEELGCWIMDAKGKRMTKLPDYTANCDHRGLDRHDRDKCCWCLTPLVGGAPAAPPDNVIALEGRR